MVTGDGDILFRRKEVNGVAKKPEPKQTDTEKSVEKELSDQLACNPLLTTLRANDKKNLFGSNVVTYFHRTGYPIFDYYFGSVMNVHNEIGEIVDQIPRLGQAAGTFNVVIGKTGVGKALPNSTKIPTPDGWKYMGDLKFNDMVFGTDGNPTQVYGVHPQGKKDVWELEFEGGRKARCSGDHLWKYMVPANAWDSDRSDRWRVKVDTTVELQRILNWHTSHTTKQLHVETPSAVLYAPRPVPVNPYVLGVFIGAGNYLDSDLTLLLRENEIPEIVAKLICAGATDSVRISEHLCSYSFLDRSGGYLQTREIIGNYPEVVDCEAYNRNIPDDYLYASQENRWDLLRGLIDSHGIVDNYDPNKPGRIRIYYYSTSNKLLLSIQQLVRSLGLHCTMHADDQRVTITGPIHRHINRLCSSDHQVEYLRSVVSRPDYKRELKRIHYDRTAIISVKELGYQEEMTCISVNAPNKLFLTEDFIPTHNTTLVVQMASNILRQYPLSTIHHYDFEQRFDISRGVNISRLPISEFDDNGRYILRGGAISLEELQEAIVKLYAEKMKNKDILMISTGQKNEFGKEISVMTPSIFIIDSLSQVITSTFSVDSNKEILGAQGLRSNMEGARDAKTLRGFFKDVLSLCKDANIIIYAINHINDNIQTSSFGPPKKQQMFLKQDESIPGGQAQFFNAFNFIKLIAKPADSFTDSIDGFAGHMIMFEPIKSSSNQSGNDSHGVSFDMVFSFKHGFDSLRSLIVYGKEKGIIEGNKLKYKFGGDNSFTFSFKNIDTEINEKPIWESIQRFILPELQTHMSFIEPESIKFDPRSLQY